MSLEEHPFAPFIRTVGRGRHGGRSLTREEAQQALAAMLSGACAPEQIGALLMLMRMRGETPEEIAGFVQAARDNLQVPPASFTLDWPSYAGKRRHLPWFLLAAKLLARKDRRILLHGADPEGSGRLGISESVQALSIPTCDDLSTCAHGTAPLVFLPLAQLAPTLHGLLGLRRLLGLRSPIHTTVRMLNPLKAEWSLQSVFHPNYIDLHVAATQQLQDPRVLVMKGDAGEFEHDPTRPTRVALVREHRAAEQTWAPILTQTFGAPRERPPIRHLCAVWDGSAEDPVGVATIESTCAIILHALDGLDPWTARAEAHRLWQDRLPCAHAMPD